MKNTQNKALTAAITANVIFGLSFLATTVALGHTTPDILLAIRFTSCIILMALLVAIGWAKVDLRGKPIGKLLILGILEPIYFLAETYGIKYTTTSFSGLIIALIPLMAAIVAVPILGDKLPLGKAGWIVCSIAGVVIISASQSSEGVIEMRGVIYLMIAVLAATSSTILNKSLVENFTAFERTFIMMLMCAVCFVAISAITNDADFLPMLGEAIVNPYVMLPIAYLAVLSSVVAFFCNNYAINHLDVAKVSAFNNIIPVVSVAAGVIIMNDPFSPVYLVAIVLILLGVYKVNTYR